MTLKNTKVQKINILRNFRIVSLRNAGFTFQEIANKFNISRQKAASIYGVYKNVPFYYEDDKVVIH